jgi:hypothetical protein
MAAVVPRALSDEVDQQRSRGDDDGIIDDGSSECIVCGEPGIPVSERNLPVAGPLEFDGFIVHRAGGDAYYHHDA